MLRIFDYLVDWWLKQCPHDGRHVLADFLDGDGKDISVKYCRRCGAARVMYEVSAPDKTWTRPQPLWFPHGKDMQ